MLDLYRLDQVFSDYEWIRYELTVFSELLAQKEELIVFSKADLLDDEMREHILWEFQKQFPDKKYFIISAATGHGLEELKDYLAENIVSAGAKNLEEKLEQEKNDDGTVVFDLHDQEGDPKRTHVEYEGDMIFKASWKRLEQIVRMTDFDNKEAIMRVYDVLDRFWVIREIEKKLSKILDEEQRDNSFFFEGSEEENISPKIRIAGREVPLEKLKYKL